jgi:CubicO group peptidase (beta-lactamase class C family)
LRPVEIIRQAVFLGEIMRLKSLMYGAGVAVLGVGGWLTVAPPEVLRVGANYTAKIVCSNVFLAGRDQDQVLTVDVQAPGHPLLKLMRVSIDKEQQIVRAGLFGFIGKGAAVHRSGTGCGAVPDGDLVVAATHQFKPTSIRTGSNDQPWPQGSGAQLDQAVQKVLSDDLLMGEGMRGVVVIHQGKLIAQRYADGFDRTTPLLGWSMTKSITAALVGAQIQSGVLKLDQTGWWPSATPPDRRDKIAVADLMAMSSGLKFNEGYGDVSDVTRMLYLEPDMAAYVRSLPLEHPIGSVWNYSSGTTVLLSSILKQVESAESLSLPHRRLFVPLGMSSAVMEADARGNLVGSSYMYATAQDWARFGQFLMQDGQWNGQRLLPEQFVATMAKVAPASKGDYGQGQVWRWGPGGGSPEGKSGDTAFGLPADTFWMLGHDAQSVAIVPSKQIVVVRLGLTPSHLNYKPQALLAAVIKAVDAEAGK